MLLHILSEGKDDMTADLAAYPSSFTGASPSPAGTLPHEPLAARVQDESRASLLKMRGMDRMWAALALTCNHSAIFRLSCFGLDQEMVAKWLDNWSPGLFLGAFCTIFRA